MDFSKLSQNVQKGNARMTNKLVQEALENGVEASVILEKGLIPALNEVGIKFKNNEIKLELIDENCKGVGLESYWD